jgi:2-phosphoglycolate phosphatase
MIRLIIFDLDGTLVDSKRDIAVSVNYMLGLYGLPSLDLETIEGYVGSGAEKLVRRSMGGAAAAIDIPEAIAKFRIHYIQHCTDSTREFPGIRPLLEHIRKSGVGLAVLTNKPSKICLKMLGDLGLSGFFGAILGAEDVPVLKPDPVSAEILEQRTGITRKEMLMVGDSPIDSDFARNAGMPCALVLYGGITLEEANLSAGADWVCRTTAELESLIKRLIG